MREIGFSLCGSKGQKPTKANVKALQKLGTPANTLENLLKSVKTGKKLGKPPGPSNIRSDHLYLELRKPTKAALENLHQGLREPTKILEKTVFFNKKHGQLPTKTGELKKLMGQVLLGS